jgi:Flp pilus assembly pilin Flp
MRGVFRLTAVRSESGQTMAEYAVIIAVVLLGASVALQTMRNGILSALSGVTSYFL